MTGNFNSISDYLSVSRQSFFVATAISPSRLVSQIVNLSWRLSGNNHSTTKTCVSAAWMKDQGCSNTNSVMDFSKKSSESNLYFRKKLTFKRLQLADAGAPAARRRRISRWRCTHGRLLHVCWSEATSLFVANWEQRKRPNSESAVLLFFQMFLDQWLHYQRNTAKYWKDAKSWNRRGATPPIFATLQGPGPTLHRGAGDVEAPRSAVGRDLSSDEWNATGLLNKGFSLEWRSASLRPCEHPLQPIHEFTY